MKTRERLDKLFCTMMLDSGAVSVWTKGLTVDLTEYCNYIEQVEDILQTYVNLDVIPSSRTDPMIVEEAAKGSWKNYQRMVRSGFSPMPVFHYSERVYWLDKILDSGIDYLGVGGLLRVSNEQLIRWLDSVFSHIFHRRGEMVKVHGFAVTRFGLMTRYPWFSCDSTSAFGNAGRGGILIPQMRDGEYCYTVAPRRIYVSERAHGGEMYGKLRDRWLKSLGIGAENRKYILDFVEATGLESCFSMPPRTDVKRKSGVDKCSARTFRLLVNSYINIRFCVEYQIKPFVIPTNLFEDGGVITVPWRRLQVFDGSWLSDLWTVKHYMDPKIFCYPQYKLVSFADRSLGGPDRLRSFQYV